MKNEITITGQQTMLDIIHGVNSDVPMNPFEKEIKLATFMVSGTLYGEQLRGLTIKLRKGTDVKFYREPNNIEEKYSIRVEAIGKTIGYVPSTISEIPSNLMDAGKLLYGRINKCFVGYAGADIMVDLYMRG